MDRPLWDRIQEIYHSTLPMSRSERNEFVASSCSHDPILLHEVNSLLEAEESSGAFLQSPVFEVGLKILSSSDQNHLDNAEHSMPYTLVGTTINKRYLVEKELGKGGMGKVYLARDLELHNRPVVIKILLEASLENPYVVKKFRQEVEALSRVDHPGVVGVLGAGELDDGKPYIVMQYVSGVTLRSQIPTEGMDLERAALILEQIGAALENVHEKGIFHRDLKPDNIMLQPFKAGTERVKVVDFGIAKVKDSVVGPSTANNVPIGTALYMSPEQLRGGDKITAASDIYSMAIIAYEMVTGRRPFNPQSAPQLLEMHREGVRVNPIALRANLSTEAQAIILRALSFEPAARYQSAAEFGESLARALVNDSETAPVANTTPTTEAVSAIPPEYASVNPAGPKARRFTFGKNWPTFIGGLLMITLVSVVVYLALIKGKGDKPPDPNTNTIADSTIGPTRSFAYWLTVQKMRNGREYKEPFPSSGQETFETDYKFRFNVNSPAPGHLYLFNEGPPAADGTSFTILYPTPETNNGSAAVGANQSIETNWNTFKGQTGTEYFWIVWAASTIPELESAKIEAFKHPKGALTGQNMTLVKDYLTAKEAEVKLRTSKDRVSQVTTVRGSGDVLVRQLDLQHR